MHLNKLQITGFRNIERAELALNPRFNYIYGENGAGKSALLEAVYCLSRGRSFRSSNAAAFIQQGAEEIVVRGELVDRGLHGVGLMKNKQGETKIRIDGESSKRVSELARLIPTQLLLPDVAGLVFDSPTLRRSYLDWGLFHVEPSYLALNKDYRRVVQQRNAWLKSTPDGIAEELDPWRKQLQALGADLCAMHLRYVSEVRPHFSAALQELAPELAISLDYYWGGLESAELAAKKLSESFARDVKFGLTHRGPHRSDLLLKALTRPASETLSRGQAKSTASALILGQTLLQIEKTGRACIILIDDFGAELDREHWVRFIGVLEGLECQVITTSTQAPDAQNGWMQDEDCNVFHVKHGRFEKRHITP